MVKPLNQKGSWHIEKLTLGHQGQSLVREEKRRQELQMKEVEARRNHTLNTPACQLSRESPMDSPSSMLPGED